MLLNSGGKHCIRINVKTRWIVKQSNFRTSTTNLAWEKSKCKIQKTNDKQPPFFMSVKFKQPSHLCGPMNLEWLSWTRSQYISPILIKVFFWNEWKHQGKLKTSQSCCTLEELAFLPQKKKAQQRSLGVLHQGQSSNNKKINKLVVNQILSKQDGSGPDVVLKQLQISGWQWDQAVCDRELVDAFTKGDYCYH